MKRVLMLASTVVVMFALLLSSAELLSVAQAQQPAASKTAGQTFEQKSCADPWRPEPEADGYWRWQAYHNLDCAIALLDDRGGASASGIMLSREDIDRLRNHVLLARQATGLIER